MVPDGLNVMWIARCSYREGSSVKPHVHDFFHIIYVVNGLGSAEVGGEKLVLRKKTLFLTPPGVRHGFEADGDAGLQTVEVKFSLTEASMAAAAAQLPRKIFDAGGALGEGLEEMMEEAVRRGPWYREEIGARLCGLIISLLRGNARGVPQGGEAVPQEAAPGEADAFFRPALDCMAANLSGQVTLEALAQAMRLNKSYFCRLFTRKYGVSPMRYLGAMRLAKARELLTYSDMNITQIADETGFRTIHYFSRFFTARVGESPNDYRRRSKNSVYVTLSPAF